MAPRNRGKGKTGGKQKKKKSVAENEVEEKYRKAALEVDILKENLALWRDVARQAKADGEGLKRRLLEREQERTTRRIFMKMIRQHQELQRQTETRMQQLETETKQLQEQLGSSGQLATRLPSGPRRRGSSCGGRRTGPSPSCGAESTPWRQSMKRSCTAAWTEKDATAMHTEYKERLSEFGLSPLEI